MVWRAFEPACWAGELHVILDEHTVMKYGEAGRRFYFLAFVETWRGVDDVIYLPLTRTADRVDVRWVLTIISASGAVRVCFVSDLIQHLNFIAI